MINWFQYTTLQLGPIPIQVWGFFVALGMLLSLGILAKRAPLQGFQKESIIDQAFWMILGGVLFARLVHVLFYEPLYFLQHPFEIFAIWHGGLSSFGGLFGAGIGFIFYRRSKKQQGDLLKIADLFSFAALYGWIVGRIGCFMIHDHLGVPCNCLLAINGPDQPRLDMALIEILALLPLALVFFFSRTIKRPPGWYTTFLFVYYGIVRFILDFFRARDISNADVRLFGLTPGQYFAILLIGVASFLFFRNRRKQ